MTARRKSSGTHRLVKTPMKMHACVKAIPVVARPAKISSLASPRGTRKLRPAWLWHLTAIRLTYAPQPIRNTPNTARMKITTSTQLALSALGGASLRFFAFQLKGAVSTEI